MRVVALFGRRARPDIVRRFEARDVDIFSGNELDPADRPAAALIFGGDGTLHFHLPALLESRTPFLHVPCGSGNDFAVSLGIHSVEQALAAWERFLGTGANTRLVDAGVITPAAQIAEASPTAPDGWERELRASETDASAHLAILGPRIMESQLRHLIEERRRAASRPHYFCCVAGVGFDSEVTRRANRMPAWIRKRGGYIVAVLQSLLAYRPQRLRLCAPAQDGVPSANGWAAELDEPALLMAIGNAPQYGSGMKIVPHALMDDGLLDVCFVRTVSLPRILRFFPTLYRGGHVGMKEVEFRRADRFRLESDLPMDIYADGEYVCPTPAEVTIVPGALLAIVP